jgi:hypothetical protein
VLTGAAYLARLNDPTPYTKRATQGFLTTSRALTRVAASFGLGPGGILATIRFAVPVDDAGIERLLAGDLLPRAAKLAQITGAHYCMTDAAASGQRTEETRTRSDIQAAPDRVVLVEGCNAAPVDAALAVLLQGLSAAGPLDIGRYRLEYLRMKTDAG